MVNRIVGSFLLFLFIQFGLCNANAQIGNADRAWNQDAKLAKPMSQFPEGVWKSVDGNTLKNRNFKSITVYSYSSNLIMIDYEELDGDQNLYPLKEPVEYSTDFLEQYYLDNEDLSFTQKSHKKALLYEDGTTTVLHKQRLPKIDKKKMVGTWIGEYENTKVSLSIDETGYITFKSGDYHFAEGAIKYDSSAGLILDMSVDGEPRVSPVFLIDENHLRLPLESSASIVLEKISDQAVSQFLLDDNGNPVTIDQLSITTKLGELIAETVLDLKFTNPNSDSSEVAFKLPLPSDAIVVGYSLDIEGKMIPCSAVEKTKARQAFEEIEARGVDPGLAEISNNNQFTTEIFPVNHKQQRRIIVSYIEPVETSKRGLVSYSFPLQKIGQISKLDINVISTSSKPKILGLDQKVRKEAVSNKNNDSKNVTWQTHIHATNYLADAPMNVRFKVKEKNQKNIRTRITQASDGRDYFTAWGKVPAAKKTKKKSKASKVIIAWDTSLSMRAYHQDYIDLMRRYIKRLSGVDVHVITFSDKVEEYDLGSGNETEIMRRLNEIEYDSASNFKHLQSILERDADYYVVLSDGLATFNSDSATLGRKAIFSISPPQAAINAPLLKALAKHGNHFELNERNKRKVADAIGVLPVDIILNSHSENLENIKVSRPYGFDSKFLITGRLNNRKNGKLQITLGSNEVQKITIEPALSISGEDGKYLWAQSTLEPLQAWPMKHQIQITKFGIKHKIATPFTSLIVLEDLDDYVEYGIEPPLEIEGFERYAELRADELEHQQSRKEESLESVLLAWQRRLSWWQNPAKSFRKNENLRQARSQFQGGFDQDGLQEILVTGSKRGTTGQTIAIEPWAPNTPYMKAILAKEKNSQYQEYLVQRNKYQSQVSFYMDVAKHFFDQGDSELGVKVVLNILEIMPDSPTMQRTVAYVLMQYQEYRVAINVLEKVNLAYSFQATSKRDLARAWEGLANQSKRSEDFTKALHYYFDAATKVDDEPSGLPVVALTEMNHLLPKAKAVGTDTSWIGTEFLGNQNYDVRVLLSWSNNQTDVDLHVVDPNELDVYYGNRYSPIGGYLPYDDVSGFGPEVYLLKSGVPGKFKIKAKYYSENTAEAFGPVTLILDLYLNYGKENEQHKTTSVRVDREKDVIDVGAINF